MSRSKRGVVPNQTRGVKHTKARGQPSLAALLMVQITSRLEDLVANAAATLQRALGAAAAFTSDIAALGVLTKACEAGIEDQRG